MRFDELDAKLRPYETVNDRCTPMETWMIARLDGKGFTKLAATLELERPFDESFDTIKDIVVRKLIEDTGFDIIYAYHQSDEISLLFKKNTEVFNRKKRKYESILSGLTSSLFTRALDSLGTFQNSSPAVFDCRIIELPTDNLVLDYFSWRQQDAARNSLNTYCYWMRRKDGLSGSQAHKEYASLSVAEKHEMLFSRDGIIFAEVPKWQINGTGIYNESFGRDGFNPITKEVVKCLRKRTMVDKKLLFAEEYRAWLFNKFLEEKKC